MGQKTPPPGLRVQHNRGHDVCWYQDPQFYAQFFLKDFQYRQYIHTMSAGLPSSVLVSRLFSAAFPKKYALTLFVHTRKSSPHDISGSKISKEMRNAVKHHLMRSNAKHKKSHVFRDFLGSTRRHFQFSTFGKTFLGQPISQIQGQSTALMLRKASHCFNQGFLQTNTSMQIMKTPHFQSSAHFINMFFIQVFKQSKKKARSGEAWFLSYRGALQQCMKIAQASPDILGIRIVCAGRLSSAERARIETRSWGRTSLQNFDGHLDYSSKAALTGAGLIGIKIWVLYASKK